MKLKESKAIRDKMYLYLEKKYKGAIAPEWSIRQMLETAYSFDQEQKQLNELILYTHPPKTHKILEVGCGFGHLTSLMISKGYNCSGFEVDPVLVGVGRDLLRLNKQDYKKIKLIKSKRLPYKSNSFDLINLNFVLDYVQDIPTLLKELKRILKPKGKIFIIAPNYQCCFSPLYAIIFLPFLPRFINKIYFKLMNRPNTTMLFNLTFISPRYLHKIFSTLNFKVTNFGQKHWLNMLKNRNFANRNIVIIKIANISSKLKLTWLLKLLSRLGFYTPLVYVLEKK